MGARFGFGGSIRRRVRRRGAAYLCPAHCVRRQLVFEKAQRKVEEAKFFVRHLKGEQSPDAVEFYFNALLNAGKNVVNALHAHIHFQEGQKQKPPTTYQLHSQLLRFLNPALASLTSQWERRATVQVKKR